MDPKLYYKSQLYFSALDKMLVEFNAHFSDFIKSIMKAVQATSPNSPNLLQPSALEPLINHYELDKEDIHPKLIQARKFKTTIHLVYLSLLTFSIHSMQHFPYC